ncbi:unnamed protein product [Oppiella nova]|uniref:SHSP domain-containing protein n=1 Tax=Oppiella nova TaxID=334625 RepID=A0A7R9MI81_9ACAR|nr:unnamed protein product [Oppiella nova]CAG2176866.1 unnamed protein product [Oppiella nova]
MRDRFVHDWDDWKDFTDNSLISRNRRHQLERRRSDENQKNEVLEDKHRFRAKLDVSHFKAHEIEIKYSDGNIVVTGKHEEVEDRQGYVSRQFTRRYVLPAEYDADLLEATISADGVLVIEAPTKRVKRVDSGERIVPIIHSHHITRNGSK